MTLTFLDVNKSRLIFYLLWYSPFSLFLFSFLVCTPSRQNSFLARRYWYRVSVIQMERDQYFGTANTSGGWMQPWRFLCNNRAGSLTKGDSLLSSSSTSFVSYCQERIDFLRRDSVCDWGNYSIRDVLSELGLTTLQTRPSSLKLRYYICSLEGIPLRVLREEELPVHNRIKC